MLDFDDLTEKADIILRLSEYLIKQEDRLTYYEAIDIASKICHTDKMESMLNLIDDRLQEIDGRLSNIK